MRRVLDADTFEAFARLLAEPDPTDLPRRAHVLRCPGDPNRRVTRLPPIFMAWMQRRCLAVDGEEPLAEAACRVEPTLARAAATGPQRRAEWRGGRALTQVSPSAAGPSVSMCPSSREALA